MKKIIILTLLLGLFSSCTSCRTEEYQINVEQTIKEDLSKVSDRDYKWYETEVLMNNFLDEETDGSINKVTNIIQLNIDGQPQVNKYTHFANGTCVMDSIAGFWIEDYELDSVKVTYNKAFQLIQEVNLPKPHSKNAVLRNPIGPLSCNPQWIFGNVNSQLWVDAVDGTVRESNPAFPEEN